ncbi:matrixin family metalloprotease, partial [bacterium]|nr:matrixin family metalloprotease [bacterium]
HVSIAKNGSAISFLTYDKFSDEGVSLDMLIFRSLSHNKPKIGNTKFNYVEGPGVKVRWDLEKEKEVSICGKQSRLLEFPVKEAINTWQEGLGKPLNFKVVYKDNYKPFSDLNQNCVFYVKNFREEASKKITTFALNAGFRHYEEGQFISSSILFFEEDFKLDIRSSDDSVPTVNLVELFEKISSPGFEKEYDKDYMKTYPSIEAIPLKFWESHFYKYYFLNTALHEMGHFIGLDHIFDETPSIMSYDYDDNVLTGYDKKAVKELYIDEVEENKKP